LIDVVDGWDGKMEVEVEVEVEMVEVEVGLI
jgi:hypothetical protein